MKAVQSLWPPWQQCPQAPSETHSPPVPSSGSRVALPQTPEKTGTQTAPGSINNAQPWMTFCRSKNQPEAGSESGHPADLEVRNAREVDLHL